MPTAAASAASMPNLISERKQSRPPISATRKPGSSRGNSNSPRALADMWKLSLRKLLKVVSKTPLIRPRDAITTKKKVSSRRRSRDGVGSVSDMSVGENLTRSWQARAYAIGFGHNLVPQVS